MAQKISDISSNINQNAIIHIKLDTGMSRLGFKCDNSSIEDICDNNLKNINIEGIYTHFATADETEKSFTYKQYERFKFVIDELEKRKIGIPIKHLSNSATTMDLDELEFDMYGSMYVKNK